MMAQGMYWRDTRNYFLRPRVRVRVRLLCPDCAEEGLTGKARSNVWCKGFCKHHAKKRGFKAPLQKKCQKISKPKVEKAIVETVKKAKQKENGLNREPKDQMADASKSRRTALASPKERKVVKHGQAAGEAGVEAHAAGSEEAKEAEDQEAKEDDARPANNLHVKVPKREHEYIQLHKQYLIEKRDKMQYRAEKTKWKMQALRKGRSCANLVAALFEMNAKMSEQKGADFHDQERGKKQSADHLHNEQDLGEEKKEEEEEEEEEEEVQQMHRRRLRKKTNATPSIDIWGLDTHQHDEEEEDDFAPPHRYFDRRVSILFFVKVFIVCFLFINRRQRDSSRLISKLRKQITPRSTDSPLAQHTGTIN